MSNRSTTFVDSHIGERVRARRRMLRISQTDLGQKLGTTFQQVQKYENGSNRISVARLIKAAEALRVPISFFLDGLETSGGSAPDLVAFFTLPHARELAEAFIALEHTGQRAAVARVAEAMAPPEPVRKVRAA